MPLILPNTIANGQDADGDKLQQNFATIAQYVNQNVVNADGSVAMTGPLLLPGAPTQTNQAATKGYVDSIGLLGEVKMYTGVTEPTSWLFCRGQALSRATYAALFAIIGTRYGTGDGTTTFNLPNFQATLPVGFNSGVNTPANVAGMWTTGLGQRFGEPEPSMPSHTHTLAHTHSIGHNHAAGTTSSAGAHEHNYRGGPGESGSGAFGINYIVDDDLTAYNVVGQVGSNGAHTHTFDVASFTGNSGAASTGTTSAASSGGASNGNYPPGLSINFIIKVL
jgi:microcystin-dependent protein